MTTKDAKNAGLVFVGEWGFPEGHPSGTGAIYCRPKDKAAVKAAYDAIEDGDLGPSVLRYVKLAGGVFVADA